MRTVSDVHVRALALDAAVRMLSGNTDPRALQTSVLDLAEKFEVWLRQGEGSA